MTAIKLKRSETVRPPPTFSELEVGEVAINTATQTLYVRGADTGLQFPIPHIYEVANKGQTADEVTSTCTMMSIALG